MIGHDTNLSVRWQGFRGFVDTGWLDLPPLTVLLGANSSGKSSLLAPLLLLKQSLASRTGATALVTRGEFVNVGAFRDFAHAHDSEGTVRFGLRWDSHPRANARRAVGDNPPGGLDLAFVRGENLDEVRLSLYRLEDVYRRIMLRRALTEDGRYTLWMPPVPDGFSVTESPPARVRRVLARVLRESKPVDFLFTTSDLRTAVLDRAADDDGPSFPLLLREPRALFYSSMVDYARTRLNTLLDDIFFLGPLREPPKRVYELSGEPPPDVGTRGEYASELLYRLGGETEEFDVVRDWLRHFDLPDSIQFEAVGDEGFAPRFGAGARANSPLDLGFGLSQLFPLIVQGVLAPPMSQLLIEQPEIHLNPRLQAGLADLLVSFANKSKGVIVETHSEHFLLRLRQLLARDEINAEDVAVYFFDRVDAESRIRRVDLGQNGYIDPNDWPTGFFDDSLREALALAHAQTEQKARHAQSDIETP